METLTTYEQPLNELTRVFLRVELLFLQIDHQIQDLSPFGTRNLIATLINLLQVLDRPDLKAKLAKELTYQIAFLNRLQQTPEVHQEKLQSTLHQLEELFRHFIDSNRKIAQNLREIELLNNLRLHLASPGGGCSFDIPVYHYWLQQPAEKREENIRGWLLELKQVRTTVFLILQLIRESGKTQTKNAEHGFYQELLDPQTNLRLLRVSLSASLPAYPEISIGRHFLSVRF
ncbi:hypothetical protein AYO45_07030, partial [Gammaproteobacteria bacterium SCGC AG-212-F23]